MKKLPTPKRIPAHFLSQKKGWRKRSPGSGSNMKQEKNSGIPSPKTSCTSSIKPLNSKKTISCVLYISLDLIKNFFHFLSHPIHNSLVFYIHQQQKTMIANAKHMQPLDFAQINRHYLILDKFSLFSRLHRVHTLMQPLFL